MLSIVVPVYNEGDNIVPLFEEIAAKIHVPHEILIVYDFDEDDTLPVLRARYGEMSHLRLIKNPTRGVLSAIKTGLAAGQGEALLVMMADLSDDLAAVDGMFERVQQGYDLVCGSRFMKGGRLIGGPWLKGMLARMAGLSLHWLTRIPTHDITNSFKMYRRHLIEAIPIESNGGFELGMELTLKAFLEGWRITELPSTWTDRVAGKSNFKLWQWLPKYLHWYFTLILGRWIGRLRAPKGAGG